MEFEAFAWEFLRRVNAEFAADGDDNGFHLHGLWWRV
jgi:hypothetical protein